MVDEVFQDAHALRSGLLEADDEKIRRILAVVDHLADPAVNQALLDPLRPRLAVLKPARPLRFSRLLFIPFDPLTVPVAEWQPGEPAIPRPALAPITRIVREGIGELAAEIDAMVAGDPSGATQAITLAGGRLWPRAAEILAKAATPSDWAATGLPPAAFPALVAIITAVLRRAPQLRRLMRSEELGGLAPDGEALQDILRDIANESLASHAIIVRLILARSPHAMPLLRRAVTDDGNPSHKETMLRAVERAIDATLTRMERATAFVETIGRGALADVGAEARRVTAILRQIETGADAAVYRPRLTAIRANLDETCRARFSRGVGETLVTRLAATARPMDEPGQAELETCARHLRQLDTSVRRVGVPGDYDQELRQAEAAINAAAAAGMLTPMRQIRLVELLAGPEAAAELYLKAFAKV